MTITLFQNSIVKMKIHVEETPVEILSREQKSSTKPPSNFSFKLLKYSAYVPKILGIYIGRDILGNGILRTAFLIYSIIWIISLMAGFTLDSITAIMYTSTHLLHGQIMLLLYSMKIILIRLFALYHGLMGNKVKDISEILYSTKIPKDRKNKRDIFTIIFIITGFACSTLYTFTFFMSGKIEAVQFVQTMYPFAMTEFWVRLLMIYVCVALMIANLAECATALRFHATCSIISTNLETFNENAKNALNKAITDDGDADKKIYDVITKVKYRYEEKVDFINHAQSLFSHYLAIIIGLNTISLGLLGYSYFENGYELFLAFCLTISINTFVPLFAAASVEEKVRYFFTVTRRAERGPIFLVDKLCDAHKLIA